MEGQGGEVWRPLSGPTASPPGLLVLAGAGSWGLRWAGRWGRFLRCLEEPRAVLLNGLSPGVHVSHFLLQYCFFFLPVVRTSVSLLLVLNRLSFLLLAPFFPI